MRRASLALVRAPLALVIVALAASMSPAVAVPPAAGGALASANVDLVATIGDAPAIGARIIGETMYVTTSQGLRIYDISLGIPVLQGALELPHFENENVDTNGQILLISADSGLGFPSNILYVIDVSNIHAPLIKSVLQTSSGHTATCINNCQYAWLSGSGQGLTAIDLTNPAAPRQVGRIGYLGTYVDNKGITRERWIDGHNVDVDAKGIAWVSAWGGLYAYDTNTYGPSDYSLLHPTLITARENGTPGAFHNNFIIHNSRRPYAAESTPALLADNTIDRSDVVLVTEENWSSAQNGLCSNDGQFQTGWFHTVSGTPTVEKLTTFKIGQGTVTDAKKPVGAVACSSHWFDEKGGIVADAWYEQGVRFLDVSNPRAIRQIGYFMPASTEVWMTRYHTVASGLTAGDYVYTFDVARGIDVLKFSGKAGDPLALAPIYNPASSVAMSAPTTKWGYACRRLLPAVSTG